MSLGESLRALGVVMRRDGVRPALARAAEVLRERVVQPWEVIYWIPAGEVLRIEAPPGASIRVVQSLEQLTPDERAETVARVDAST